MCQIFEDIKVAFMVVTIEVVEDALILKVDEVTISSIPLTNLYVKFVAKLDIQL